MKASLIPIITWLIVGSVQFCQASRVVYRVEISHITLARAPPLRNRTIQASLLSSQLSSTTDSSSTSLATSYFVPVTYTPLSTCSGSTWTYVTTVPLTTTAPPGTDVWPFVERTTTDFVGTTSTTTVYVVLNPADVDPSVFSSASSAHEPPGVSLCRDPLRSSTLSESGGTTKTSITSEATQATQASPEGIRCGDKDPTCEECTLWIEYCYGACPPITDEYYECHDGKKYRAGAESLLSNRDIRRLGMATLLLWGGLWMLRVFY
jgi:hypothetical protein